MPAGGSACARLPAEGTDREAAVAAVETQPAVSQIGEGIPGDRLAGQHLPGSWHLDLNGNFATFAGWLLSPDRDLYIVADGAETVGEAIVWLRRVGFDRVRGYLDVGMYEWARQGLPTAHVAQVGAPEVRSLATGSESITLLAENKTVQVKD